MVIMALLLAPVWCVCFFLVAETAWRIYSEVRFVVANSYIKSETATYLEADDLVFQDIQRQTKPPDSVLWDLTPRTMFFKLDEAGRQELARERKELILVCNDAGKIERVYPCVETRELEMLSSRLKPGEMLDVVLPEAELADALDIVRQAEADRESFRDYHVPLATGEKYLAEFSALRFFDKPRVAVFLRDSRYQILGHSYRPNIYRHNWYREQFLNSEFWTNSRGFRDKEITLPKPTGVVRIVCVGGSTTVEGPHNELTYPKIMEKMLRERFATDAIEVINCGVDALGFPFEMERMPDWLTLEPDLILHYNIVNNMPTTLYNAIRKSGMRDGWKGRMREVAAHSRLLATLFRGWFLPEEKFVVEEFEFRADTCFKVMNNLMQAKGGTLAIASFTVPDIDRLSKNERLYFDRSFHVFPLVRATTADYNWAMDIYNRTVSKFCRENGLLYIPVAENFSGGVDTFTDICHMRLRGIELKAKIMVEHLEDFVRERLETTELEEAS